MQFTMQLKKRTTGRAAECSSYNERLLLPETSLQVSVKWNMTCTSHSGTNRPSHAGTMLWPVPSRQPSPSPLTVQLQPVQCNRGNSMIGNVCVVHIKSLPSVQCTTNNESASFQFKPWATRHSCLIDSMHYKARYKAYLQKSEQETRTQATQCTQCAAKDVATALEAKTQEQYYIQRKQQG